jgi:hypothetical protein
MVQQVKWSKTEEPTIDFYKDRNCWRIRSRMTTGETTTRTKAGTISKAEYHYIIKREAERDLERTSWMTILHLSMHHLMLYKDGNTRESCCS